MALWLVRGGKHGEHEQRFLDENRVYLTWDGLASDLSGVAADWDKLKALLAEFYPDFGPRKVGNHAGQIWAFAQAMQAGDWIVMPRKGKAAFAFAEILGGYEHHPQNEDPYFHSRRVKWLETDVPRSIFDQDILYSLGAIMTICQIKRNDAEARVRKMAASGWKKLTFPPVLPPEDGEEPDESNVDLEQLARDQIAKAIIAKFKGHGLARLVEALLQAQGYTTYLSPEGPDKGIDILAAPGPLGFGQPRICVQVKSSDSPVDHPTLNQLVGAMQSVQAGQGLLVSWGGFRSSVSQEEAAQFFKVRFWGQDDIIDELFAHYDKLDEDIRTELPLKRLWTLAVQEDE